MFFLQNNIKNKEIIVEKPDVILFTILSTLRTLHLWIPKKEHLSQEELVLSLSHIFIKGVSNV